MVCVTFGNKVLEMKPAESVLDALLRNGHDIPHGCKAGACHTCMMHLEAGVIPAAAQKGLKPNQQLLGTFLSCCCVPDSDVNISLTPQERPVQSAVVISSAPIRRHILRIQLQSPFAFRAGQYINVWHKAGNLSESQKSIIRSYSIASLPHEECIELHVKVIPEGLFSSWASQCLHAGDSLMIQGPLGGCFYIDDALDRSILLVGIGTGLAPLYGIVRDALYCGHRGPIHLVVGARSADDFYLLTELHSLSERNPQLFLLFVAQEGENPKISSERLINGDLYAVIKQRFTPLTGYLVYLCGAASFVGKMKKQCFLLGASMKDIHTDSFLPCS